MQQSKLPSLFKFMPPPGEEETPELEKPGESSASAGASAGTGVAEPKRPSRKGKEKAVEPEQVASPTRPQNTNRRQPPRLLDAVSAETSVPMPKGKPSQAACAFLC